MFDETTDLPIDQENYQAPYQGYYQLLDQNDPPKTPSQCPDVLYVLIEEGSYSKYASRFVRVFKTKISAEAAKEEYAIKFPSNVFFIYPRMLEE